MDAYKTEEEQKRIIVMLKKLFKKNQEMKFFGIFWGDHQNECDLINKIIQKKGGCIVKIK